MTAFLGGSTFDNGLQYLTDNADAFHWCSSQPATYAEVLSFSLGNKSNPTVGAPAGRSPDGRKITVSAITNGTCTATGTASHWALVDAGNSLLLAANTLATPVSVVSGDTLRSSAFDVGIPGSAAAVLEINGTPILTTVEDVPYAGFTVSATGGTAPYTYSVNSGTLPTGITLNSSTGSVSGTPTTPGTSSGIVIRVTDAVAATDDLASFDLEVTATGSLTDLITDTATYTPAGDPMPDYLDPYVDPNFGPTLLRVTGVPGTQIGGFTGKLWGTYCRATYNKNCAWNADESLFWIETNSGSGAWGGYIFLDGETFEPLYCSSIPSGLVEARWHETDPDIMVFVTSTAVKWYSVSGNSVTTKHDFSGTYSSLTIGKFGGELSQDSDIIPLIGTKTGSILVAVAFEISTNTVLCEINLDALATSTGKSFSDVENGISPLGNYMYVMANDETIYIYNIDGTLNTTWSNPGKPSHFGMVLYGGEEFICGSNRASGGGGHVVRRRMPDGATTTINSNSFAYASSGTAHGGTLGGLVVVSDYFADSGTPYVKEIVISAMDGSGVGRICHNHKSAMTGDSDLNYHNEPQASHARLSKRVTFKTSWDDSVDASPIAVFVADYEDFQLPGVG